MTVTTQPSKVTVRDFVYCDEELTYMVDRHNRDDPGNQVSKALVEDVRDVIIDFCDDHEEDLPDDDEVCSVIDLNEHEVINMASAIQQVIKGTNLYSITPDVAHALCNIIYQECIRNGTLTVVDLCAEQTVRMVGNLQAKVLSTTR